MKIGACSKMTKIVQVHSLAKVVRWSAMSTLNILVYMVHVHVFKLWPCRKPGSDLAPPRGEGHTSPPIGVR